jgi:hypothetical protein
MVEMGHPIRNNQQTGATGQPARDSSVVIPSGDSNPVIPAGDSIR